MLPLLKTFIYYQLYYQLYYQPFAVIWLVIKAKRAPLPKVQFFAYTTSKISLEFSKKH